MYLLINKIICTFFSLIRYFIHIYVRIENLPEFVFTGNQYIYIFFFRFTGLGISTSILFQNLCMNAYLNRDLVLLMLYNFLNTGISKSGQLKEVN